MSYVLVFAAALIGSLELNTYADLESCEAARQAATQAKAELEWATKGDTQYAEYICIPKPA